jgi:membrane fusion protein
MTATAELSAAPDSESPFLEVDPPHWAARGITYVLMLLFASLAIAAIFVHIPETVSGPFVLTPVRGTDPVRSAHGGRVTDVRVAEGEDVDKGSVLFVLQSDPVGDRFAEFRTLEAQTAGVGGSLTNATRQYEAQRQADEKERRKLRDQALHLTRIIELKEQQLALARELAARYKKGLEGGFTSWEEYSRPQMEADRLAVELAESQGDRALTLAALEALGHQMAVRDAEFRELERTLQEGKERASIRMGALERELENTEGNLLSVRAPCSGTVLRLQVQGVGAVVQEGEMLGELACGAEGLQAQLMVPQAGMAVLKPGLRVKLLYDAFPYQRYGVKHGRLRWISPASSAMGDSSAFRAFVEIEDTAIRVRGQARPLRVGMGGKASVVVGRRSLISYAFQPIRQLKESLAETPETETREK